MSDIEMSPAAGALFAALSKAQNEIEGAVKSAINPHLKSRYADLADTWAACRVALHNHGLCVVQTTRQAGEKGVCVVTTLGHSSGEWIRGEIYMPASKPDAQGFGSALTYARRYSLAAIVGVSPEDDDGAAATTGKPAHGPIKTAPAPELEEKLEESVDLMAKAKTLSSAISSAKTRGSLNEVWLGALDLKRAGLPAKAYARLEALRAEAIDRLSTSAAE